jgi:hypothetical protein
MGRRSDRNSPFAFSSIRSENAMRPLLFMLLCALAAPSFADGNAVRFDPAHRTKPAVILFWATSRPAEVSREVN